MGFSSIDDMVNETTSNGKTYKNEWMKSTGGAAYTAGRWYSMFTLAGAPAAGTYSGTALNAQAPTDATAGALFHGGNVSTDTKHILNASAMTAVATGAPGVLMLVDIALYYPGINVNLATAQTLVNTTTLTRYTTGAGLFPFFEVGATTGATAHNIALSYTNQAGTAGRALGATVAMTASAIVPHIAHSGTASNNYGPFLPLAAGDTGVRSVQTLTFSAASGTASTGTLVLAKPILRVPLTVASIPTILNTTFDMPPMPQIVDGACLAWIYFAGAATAAATPFNGNIDLGWG